MEVLFLPGHLIPIRSSIAMVAGRRLQYLTRFAPNARISIYDHLTADLIPSRQTSKSILGALSSQ